VERACEGDEDDSAFPPRKLQRRPIAIDGADFIVDRTCCDAWSRTWFWWKSTWCLPVRLGGRSDRGLLWQAESEQIQRGGEVFERADEAESKVCL